MIQRIQSIYLFLAFITMILIFFFPLADLLVKGDIYTMNYRGVYLMKTNASEAVINTYPLSILFLVISLISIITIFLFKKRKLQMRLCTVNIILLLGSLGLAYFYLSFVKLDIEPIINYKLTVAFPIIAVIFTILANRGIKKDEKLVRSLDRIR